MDTRVIIVDDHRLIRDSLRLILRQEPGLSIIGEAARVATAMELIRSLQPDLVIMDIRMPDGDGLEATRQLKKEFPTLRILIVSGSERESAVKEAIAAGASGFVCKEESQEEILRAVRALLAGRSYLCPHSATELMNTQGAPAESSGSEAVTLGDKERLLLKLVAGGLRNKEIADEMGLGVKSVEAYRSRLMKKLHCEGAADLVKYALRAGIAKL